MNKKVIGSLAALSFVATIAGVSRLHAATLHETPTLRNTHAAQLPARGTPDRSIASPNEAVVGYSFGGCCTRGDGQIVDPKLRVENERFFDSSKN